MDLKGSEVTEVRTGRIGTVISSDLDYVSVQYEDVRKTNCPWSHVRLLNEKNRNILKKALNKRKRTVPLKSSALAKQNQHVPLRGSAPPRHRYVVITTLIVAFYWFAYSVQTKFPSSIESVNSEPSAYIHTADSFNYESSTTSFEPAVSTPTYQEEPIESLLRNATDLALLDAQILLNLSLLEGSDELSSYEHFKVSQAIDREVNRRLGIAVDVDLTPDYSNPSIWSTSKSFGCAENGSCYGDISDVNGMSKTIKVDGYHRSDGTYVRGHYRSKGQ
jgi:hypothetical protein